jgi:hypothetical protein
MKGEETEELSRKPEFFGYESQFCHADIELWLNYCREESLSDLERNLPLHALRWQTIALLIEELRAFRITEVEKKNLLTVARRAAEEWRDFCHGDQGVFPEQPDFLLPWERKDNERG